MWQDLGILVNVGNGRFWLEKVGRPGKFWNSFRGARSRKAEKAPQAETFGAEKGLNYHEILIQVRFVLGV
jgi:hypothetical protein